MGDQKIVLDTKTDTKIATSTKVGLATMIITGIMAAVAIIISLTNL